MRLVLSLILICWCSLAQANLRDGQVGWWWLEETLPDSSGNGNTGTATGTTIISGCPRSNCRSFNGSSDLIDFGTGTSINQQTAMTWAAWVYERGAGYPTTEALTAASTDGNTGNYAVLFGMVSGGGNERLISFINAANLSGINSVSSIPNGVWTHVAMTRTGSSGSWTINIYINGALDNTGVDTTNPNGTTGEKVAIGRFGGYNGIYFNGFLDDVRTYNRALTANEIFNLYNPGGTFNS